MRILPLEVEGFGKEKSSSSLSSLSLKTAIFVVFLAKANFFDEPKIQNKDYRLESRLKNGQAGRKSLTNWQRITDVNHGKSDDVMTDFPQNPKYS